MNNLLLVALFTLFSAVYVMADCPNSCSGHGTCGKNAKCTCYPDYGNADCSVRSCPVEVNLASGVLEECSGRGTCDTKNGDCKCDAGYEGEACGRESCPNDCSGHGSCVGSVERYCTCDFGYSGYDCSGRQCPRGDDPLTTETYPGSGKDQQNEIQEVSVGLSASGYTIDGQFVLTFEDSYGGSWTTRPIAVKDSATETVTIDASANAITRTSETVLSFASNPWTTQPIAGSTITFNYNGGTTYRTTVVDVNTAGTQITTGSHGQSSQSTNNLVITFTNTNNIEAKEVEDIIEALPNQAVPDVTVSKSSQTDLANVYQVTFISGANSGDVNPLKCSVSGCDLNGCQPRYTGVLKKRTFTNPVPTANSFAINFFSDKQADVSLTIDASANNIAVTSTALTFTTTPFTSTKMPLQGAEVTAVYNGGTAISLTAHDVSLNGLVLTFTGAHGLSAMTANNLVLTWKNAANTAGILGTYQYSLKDILGLAAPSTVKGVSVAADGWVVEGTGIAGIDLRNYIEVGDKIFSSTIKFNKAGNTDHNTERTVSAVTATKVTISGGAIGTVTAADVITAAGDTTTFLIRKQTSTSIFGSLSAGDTVEFSGSTSNNKVLSVVSVSEQKRSVVLSGNVVTEAVGTTLSATVRRSTTSAEATCTVSEVMQGTKESSVCSGRGSCDGSAGTCTCYSGYTGESCNTQIQEM